MPKSLVFAAALAMGLCLGQSGAYAQTDEDMPPSATDQPEATDQGAQEDTGQDADQGTEAPDNDDTTAIPPDEEDSDQEGGTDEQ
jgi:hypothetical protein